MIPELGHIALIIGLQLALLQGVLGLAGASRGNSAWMRVSRRAVGGQFVFVLGGFLALAWAFLRNDFSVMNVADHSSRALPLAFRLSAVWGSHEGSFLLWALLLAGWSLAVANLDNTVPAELRARVLGVLGLLSFLFLAFILFTSNPFLRLHPPPADGSDLNPLLQDPGMILHPPALYMGYVGFAIAFAFANAALLGGRFDEQWSVWLRPWTLAAWAFLTLGIMIGSWWAYYELGWGGWWFWDPTENASLMPWLAGTALLHSLSLTRRRQQLKVWTLFLAIVTFSLSLLGTFLVRSGVLSSVHAFAQDPARGSFILVILLLAIGGSLLLFAFRAGDIQRDDGLAIVSREAAMLAGIVLLLVAIATVLLGTLYPLVLDALGVAKVSVGAPYFNAVFVPLVVPVLVLMGVVPLLGRTGEPAHSSTMFAGSTGVVVVCAAILLPLAMGELIWQAAVGSALAVWILVGTIAGLVRRRRKTRALTLTALGMGCAHIGVAVTVIGVSFVSAYENQLTVSMRPGSGATLAGYEFVFGGASEFTGPNFDGMRGDIEVRRDGLVHARLWPEKRIYHSSRMTMTEAAIRYGLGGDIYATLGEPLGEGRWSVHLYSKPFVGWIWAGALLMALGGVVAACSRRPQRIAP